MSISKKEGEAKEDKVKEDQDDTITTGVDDLLKLVEEQPKISVDEAQKKLKVGKGILKSWIDFLVEEKILGIEYSFTTPYIYLNKPKQPKKTEKVDAGDMNFNQFKREFIERAKKNKIPADKMEEYWKEHLNKRLELNKDFFFRQAKAKNLPQPEKLWEMYRNKVMST